MKRILNTLFLFTCIINGDSHIQFVTKYIEILNIKMCYFLTCWTKYENLELAQNMDARNIKYSFLESTNRLNQTIMERGLVYYAYILDLTCKTFNESLLREINNKTLRIERPWLLLTNTSVSDLEDIFQNVRLRLDSFVRVAVPEKNKTLKIFDAYNTGFQLGKNAVFTEVGYWNGSHLSLNSLKFYIQRKDMSNMQLRSASVVVDNKTLQTMSFKEHMEDIRHPYSNSISKFNYAAFRLLEYVHKFTHTVILENKWFGDYENGTDAAIARLLYKEEIDVTCTGAAPIYSIRVYSYEFLDPSYHLRPCFLFRNPGSYNPLTNKFREPFSTTVWSSIILVLVLTCILLQVFHRTENKFVGLKSKYSWASTILTTLAVTFQQDSAAFPKGPAGRIAYLVLQFLSLLLYNYYTSRIISSLLRKPPEAFHTLDELGHSNLEMAIENLPYTLTYLKIKKTSDVQYIYNHKLLPPGAKHLNVLTVEEGIAKVGRGGFAYYTLLDTAYSFAARTFDHDAICDLSEMKMIPYNLAGIMLPKKSQYKELFLITLRKAKEVGLTHRISQMWQIKKPECLSKFRVMAVGIDQVFIGFLMLFIGMTVSLLLLVIEIIWYKLDLDRRIA